MKRKPDFILVIVFMALLCSLMCCHATQAESLRPNIILIMTDDQGYSDVGCFGAAGFRTPHLDRLARESRRFTDFYVAASVCTASRAALMTGCYPTRNGFDEFYGIPYSNDNSKSQLECGSLFLGQRSEWIVAECRGYPEHNDRDAGNGYLYQRGVGCRLR